MRNLYCYFVASALLAMCVDSTNAAEPLRSRLLTGHDFRSRLESRVGIAWASEPLRLKIDKLANTLEVAIWLDRRIDPSQEPEIQLADVSLRQCLEEVAARLNAGVAVVSSVVYIGPRPLADKLATLAELRNDDCAHMAPSVRRRFTQIAAWKWETLAEPRTLLTELAREAQVTVEGLTDIPHDLWPAMELPPLTFAERLTLILAGFDRTFELDPRGDRLRLIGVPDSVQLDRTYPWSGEGGISLAGLQQSIPNAAVRREGSRVRIQGRAEDHQLAAELLGKVHRAQTPGGRVRTKGEARTVYTMQGPALLGTVLKTLQVQTRLRVNVDPSIQEELYRRVMFQVKNVSLEELLAAVLKDTGLRFELTDEEIRIQPGK